MRFAALASLLTAGAMWLALGGSPAQSQTEAKPATCETCAKGAECPYCAAGKECPHCAAGKGCAHCGHRGHGKWGAHKWEYKCVRGNKRDPGAMTAQFNGLGEEGWRLKEADSGIWCFTRISPTQ